MAIYNEIQTGRLNRFLQKALGIKGGPPAPQLQADIGTTLNLFSGAENRILESWNIYSENFNVTGGAAQTGAFRIRNPANSGILAVFEKISIGNPGAAGQFSLEVQFNAAGTDLTTPLTPTNRDQRVPGFSGLKLSQTTNGTPLGAALLVGCLVQNTMYDCILTDDQEFVLSPGGLFQINDLTAAHQLFASVWYRERPIEDSEKVG